MTKETKTRLNNLMRRMKLRIGIEKKSVENFSTDFEETFSEIIELHTSLQVVESKITRIMMMR